MDLSTSSEKNQNHCICWTDLPEGICGSLSTVTVQKLPEAHEDPLASVSSEYSEVDKSNFLLSQIKQPVDLDTMGLNCWVGPALIGRGRISAVPPTKLSPPLCHVPSSNTRSE